MNHGMKELLANAMIIRSSHMGNFEGTNTRDLKLFCIDRETGRLLFATFYIHSDRGPSKTAHRLTFDWTRLGDESDVKALAFIERTIIEWSPEGRTDEQYLFAEADGTYAEHACSLTLITLCHRAVGCLETLIRQAAPGDNERQMLIVLCDRLYEQIDTLSQQYRDIVLNCC